MYVYTYVDTHTYIYIYICMYGYGYGYSQLAYKNDSRRRSSWGAPRQGFHPITGARLYNFAEHEAKRPPTSTVDDPLAMTNAAMEHGPLIVDVPIKNGDFSIVMWLFSRE